MYKCKFDVFYTLELIVTLMIAVMLHTAYKVNIHVIGKNFEFTVMGIPFTDSDFIEHLPCSTP